MVTRRSLFELLSLLAVDDQRKDVLNYSPQGIWHKVEHFFTVDRNLAKVFLLCKPAAIISDNRRSEVPTGCGEHPSRRADCPASQCMRPVLLLIYTNRSTGSDTFLQYFHPISCPAYLVNSSVFGMPTSSSRLRKWSPECHPDGLLTTWNGRSSFDMLPSLITNITAL